jgi:hypothetical protein
MRNRQRGQALIEFALILPVAVMLLGYGLNVYQLLSTQANVQSIAWSTAQCLHEGTQPICNGTNTGPNTGNGLVVAGAALQNIIFLSGVVFGRNNGAPQIVGNGYIQNGGGQLCPQGCQSQAGVSLQYSYTPLFPFYPFPSTLTVTGNAIVP